MEFFAAIGSRLKESIGLDKRGQLGLDDKPFLLIVGGLGDAVSMSSLMAEFEGLPQGNIDVVLSVMVEIIPRSRSIRLSGPGSQKSH